MGVYACWLLELGLLVIEARVYYSWSRYHLVHGILHGARDNKGDSSCDGYPSTDISLF
jgi:hypothetical protein